MNDYYRNIAVVAVIGLALGFAGSNLYSSQGKCGELQDQLRDQQDFNGSLTCHPPGAIEVNLSEKVENKTELQCVCRKIKDGETLLLPITRTS